MERFRQLIQLISAFVANCRLLITPSNPIYKGPLKHVCFPGLNCYSCPATPWACPLGALQSAFASLKANLAAGKINLGLYVIGSLGVVASLVGRMPCGWFCPFGLFQDILFRIRLPKLELWRPLTWGRYLSLIFLVIILPIFLTDKFGYGQTSFCKYLCPAGTLEAGIPLLIMSPELRSAIGTLFYGKFALMGLFIFWSMVTIRPFCRTLCPLGLILGLFNKVSWLRLRFHQNTCVDCHACELICPTGVFFATGRDDINSTKCIRCFRCYALCPGGAVTIEFSSIMKGELENIEGCDCNQKQG